ncbi:hypothetical protein BJ741DRAFT_134416 [Chytriomyces cf. hyalinus JEL632]|nr:hypothetical protein BJ741DRAFT_134416 [Chytriomyces cf. hyalinus JEL632]
MFWDKLCLVSADEWEEDGFVRALSVASVAFLIVTPSILSDPNSTHLLSNSNDNVLLEWELAIDHHLNNQCTVVPIFVSSSPDTVFSKESLAIKDMNSYHTHSYYEKSRLKPKRTISETLDVVLSLRGICINLQEHGESSDDAKTATILNPTGVSAMLQLYRISSNRNDAQSRIPDASAHDSLKMLLGVESPFELWYSDVSAAKDENRIPKLNADNSLLGVVKRDLRIWIDSPNTDVIVIPTDRFIEVCEGSSSKIDSRATMPPAAHLMDVLTHLQAHNKFLGLLSLSSKPHTIKSSVLQFIYSLCHYNSAYSKFILDSASEIPSFNVTSLMAKLLYEALERKLIANEPSIILVELLSDHETSKDHALKKNELQVLSWVIKLFEGRAKIVISGVNSLVPWNFLGEHFADRLAEYQWEDALEESAKIAARSVGGTLDLSAGSWIRNQAAW